MKPIKISIEEACPQLDQIQSIALTQREDYIKETCSIYKHTMVFAKQYYHNKLTNILPFTLISVPILGKKLISMPFDGSFGGAIAINKAPVSIELYRAVLDYAKEKKINLIEIRSRVENDELLKALNFTKHESLTISELKLTNLKENKGKLRKGHRAAIGFAEKNGLMTTVSKSYDDLKKFYQIMSINMRQFATPMYPWSYFSRMWERYMESGNFILIKSTYNGKMVSGLILLLHHNTAIYKYGAALFPYLYLRPYQGMLWKAIEISIANGCTILNMGTSFKYDKGLISFKKGFGAESFPLMAYTYSFKGQPPNIDVYLKKFGWIKNLWKYQPIKTTQLIGQLFWRWFC